jgi:hypothetical protein
VDILGPQNPKSQLFEFGDIKYFTITFSTDMLKLQKVAHWKEGKILHIKVFSYCS